METINTAVMEKLVAINTARDNAETAKNTDLANWANVSASTIQKLNDIIAANTILIINNIDSQMQDCDCLLETGRKVLRPIILNPQSDIQSLIDVDALESTKSIKKKQILESLNVVNYKFNILDFTAKVIDGNNVVELLCYISC